MMKISYKTPGKLLRNWRFHIVVNGEEAKTQKRSCRRYSFTSSLHLRIYCLLLLFLLIFHLSLLLLNLKSKKFCKAAQTSNPVLILFLFGMCICKECASLLVPTMTNIVNLSLASGQFHPILKESLHCSRNRL